MDTIKKRILMFLLLCIPARIALVLLAYFKPNLLPILGGLAIIVALGFLTIFFGGFRKTGAETFGQKIWWNNLRPVHAILYIAFAYLAFTKNKKAWVPLLIDVILGLGAFIVYHGINSNYMPHILQLIASISWIIAVLVKSTYTPNEIWQLVAASSWTLATIVLLI